MKRRSASGLLCLVCSVLSVAGFSRLGNSWHLGTPGTVNASQKINFGRHFHVGDKDVIQISVDSTDPTTGDGTLAMTSSEEVVKIYKDGGADLKFMISNLKLAVGGKDLVGNPPTHPESENMRVTKFGSPNELDDHNSVRISWIGIIYQGMAALKGGLNIGQAGTFESVDPPLTNTHMKGSLKLIEVKDGLAVLHLAAEEGFIGGDTIAHLEGTYWVETNSSKLEKVDLTASETAPHKGVAHAMMTRQPR